jgi:hypothetical protein
MLTNQQASAPAFWALALAGEWLVVFAAVAFTGPGRIDILDGHTRYEVARSLVEHGDSIIRDKDVVFPVFKGRDGERYTLYRFPQSGLGVVAILLADLGDPGKEMRRHFFFTLISPCAAAILALTYTLWFHGLGYSPRASLLWGAAGIFCTPNWYYATSTFDDMLGTVSIVVAVAVAFLSRQRRPILGAAIAGLALGWAVNCKQPYGLFALPVLACFYSPRHSWRQQWVPPALVILGLVLGVVSYKLYDWYKFPPGTTDPYEAYAKLYGSLYTANPLPGLASLALSPAAGILWYCPTLLLSYHGWLCWRRQWPFFSYAVLASCLAFVLFLSFLTFYKGDPCWGPRYLTPALGLCWVFVPAACARLRRGVVATALVLGAAVQLLGLSVDPQRLFLERSLPFSYYQDAPWQNFEPSTASLVQRPREIVAILADRHEHSPFFSPSTYPTAATYLPSKLPVALTSAVGVRASPETGCPGLLAFCPELLVSYVTYTIKQNTEAVHRYHVFSSLRPWWISQQYLTPNERPVALGETLALLAGMAALGLALMLFGWRRGSSAGLACQEEHG